MCLIEKNKRMKYHKKGNTMLRNQIHMNESQEEGNRHENKKNFSATSPLEAGLLIPKFLCNTDFPRNNLIHQTNFSKIGISIRKLTYK